MAGRQGGQIDALLVQALQHGRKTFSGRAPDDRVARDPAVPQIDLADRRAFLPHFWRRRAGREPRRAALDEECGNARRAACAGIGPRQHRKEAGDRGQRDIALRTVEDVAAVGLGFGPRRKRSGIRARALFGQRQAADEITRGKTRQIRLLLLCRAVADQAFRADPGILRPDDAVGDRALAELDEGEGQLLLGQFAAAVGPGDAPAKRAKPAQFGEDGGIDPVLAFDPLLVGDGDLGDEATRIGQQILQAGGIGDHGVRPLSTLAR
jgi:hypothetical protein